jgi:hypothetical protein
MTGIALLAEAALVIILFSVAADAGLRQAAPLALDVAAFALGFEMSTDQCKAGEDMVYRGLVPAGWRVALTTQRTQTSGVDIGFGVTAQTPLRGLLQDLERMSVDVTRFTGKVHVSAFQGKTHRLVVEDPFAVAVNPVVTIQASRPKGFDVLNEVATILFQVASPALGCIKHTHAVHMADAAVEG